MDFNITAIILFLMILAWQVLMWKKIIMERLKHKESSNTFNIMLNDVKQLKSGLEVRSLEVKEASLLM